MRKKILILMSFGIFLLSPALAFADCLDLGGFTGWVVEGSHTIVFIWVRDLSHVSKYQIARLMHHPLFFSSKVTFVIQTIL
jgi:hypothetical protein